MGDEWERGGGVTGRYWTEVSRRVAAISGQHATGHTPERLLARDRDRDRAAERERRNYQLSTAGYVAS
eukprot:scaffold25825_cov131-Isochrysis_galbana.AAC.2